MKLAMLLFPALLAGAPLLPAQSLLMVVRETLNGTPLAAPYSSRERLASSFYDAGLIIFDLPGSAPAAGLLAGHAAYTLRSVPGGAVVLRGTLDGTNRDREGTVTRQALGLEMGGLVAQKVAGRLSEPVS